MKIIKPQSLGLLTRPFEFKRRFYLGISTLAFIPLGSEPALLSEVSMWKFVATELGGDAVLETGIPKRWSEFLVTGKACIPEPNIGCQVRVQLGDREKVLHVFGDRYWEGMSFTDPEPFREMPLDWSRAYGGEGYAKNPLGKGFAADGRKPLPNIEAPAQPLTSPSQRPEPVGFGPLDLTWPQRATLAGTHDQRWLKQDFPGFARDIDWHFFNLAAPDQQYAQPLRGDESYQLDNLHPQHPRLIGQLPGIATRCFINRRKQQQVQFDEVKTRLMTVWLFPNAARAVLIHQGFVRIEEEDAADVLHLIAGAEWLQQPKPPQHYATVLEARLDKETGPLLALRDSDLLPEGLDGKDPALEQEKALTSGEGLMRRHQRAAAEREIEERRAMVAGYGLDPNEHGPQPLPPEQAPPDLEQLPEYMARLQAEAAQQKAEALEWRAKENAAMAKTFADLGMDYSVIEAEQRDTPRGPPTFSAAAERQTLEQLSEDCRRQGMDSADIDGLINDPARQKRQTDAEQQLRDAYQQGAHHQNPAPLLTDEQAVALRQAVLQAYQRGESLARRDLTGADLAGLVLPGIDLSGAFLESARLDGADLSGANLLGAVLAHASLRETRLDGADLHNANLGGALLNGASLRQADLRHAQLAKADLSQAQCQAALLDHAEFTGTRFAQTDFSEARGEQLTFLECDLRGLQLRGAQLRKCNFLKVDISGSDFTSAVLESSVFLAATGQNCQFQETRLTNLRLVENCDFSSSDFSNSILQAANLRGSRLEGCNFSQALLDDADLSECCLAAADLYRASGRATRFVKADLTKARLVATNLMGAVLSRADLRGADFTGANLFQVDLARCHADRSTRFTDALTTKARIDPRRRETAL